eukprot:CAMPEP_0197321096 /NCGR_PEP_ID=MMETSP0891-20130614/63250_1 /TAXON_ID=44058 ORGANISM="Aureoumbra lagunensis, Strain CCMP1510" /NCGR_SAMPLE_ID=MMETSP0891 /ASSEMBLY_ACC=CAM_ASM_000534 /LENGTH=318 /DNA_ID=CAMNT_0042812785 /DNA_START=462 /DNA_END=1414 /DNA_ORIENTATION=-
MRTWQEGMKLAAQMNFRYPQFMPTPLNAIVPNASSEAIILIEDLLKYDPQARPTASQTLQYPFFQVNATLPPSSKAQQTIDKQKLNANEGGEHLFQQEHSSAAGRNTVNGITTHFVGTTSNSNHTNSARSTSSDILEQASAALGSGFDSNKPALPNLDPSSFGTSNMALSGIGNNSFSKGVLPLSGYTSGTTQSLHNPAPPSNFSSAPRASPGSLARASPSTFGGLGSQQLNRYARNARYGPGISSHGSSSHSRNSTGPKHSGNSLQRNTLRAGPPIGSALGYQASSQPSSFTSANGTNGGLQIGLRRFGGISHGQRL